MVFKRLFADFIDRFFLKKPESRQVLIDWQTQRRYQNLGDNVNNPAEEQVSRVSPEDESPESE